MNNQTENTEKRYGSKEQAIAQFIRDNSSRFISIVYTNSDGEKSRYIIQPIPDMEKAYQRSLKKLNLMRPRDEIGKTARQELINSVKESLEKGIGNNSQNTQKDVVKEHKDNIIYLPEKGAINFMAMQVSKKVIEPSPVEKKKVNSAPKTIAKNKMRKKTPIGRIRTFSINLDKIESISCRGMKLQIN